MNGPKRAVSTLSHVYVDHQACDAFWREYLARLPVDHSHRSASPDRFGFGGTPALADELAALVLAGRKRATASLPIEFAVLNEPLPQSGDLSIIVRGDGSPAAIIERTHVESRPFDLVDPRFASIEGEGDGSLAYWREAHIEYFSSVAAQTGADFSGQTPVLCQTFRVVWPAPDTNDGEVGNCSPDSA